MNFLDNTDDWVIPAPRRGQTLLDFVRSLDPKLALFIARAYELEWFPSNYLMPRSLGTDPCNPNEDDTARAARIARSIVEQMRVDNGHECPCFDAGWRAAEDFYGLGDDDDDEPTGVA